MRQENPAPSTPTASQTLSSQTLSSSTLSAHAGGAVVVATAAVIMVASAFFTWLIAAAPVMGETGDRGTYLAATVINLLAAMFVGGLGLAIRGTLPPWASSTTLFLAGLLACYSLGFVGGGG